jgi:hypothetical protein
MTGDVSVPSKSRRFLIVAAPAPEFRGLGVPVASVRDVITHGSSVLPPDFLGIFIVGARRSGFKNTRVSNGKHVPDLESLVVSRIKNCFC